jgi:inositol oxygenase
MHKWTSKWPNAFGQGCALSDKIGKTPIDLTLVYHDLFAENPDFYQEGCGLENVILSFGHDEFLYNVVKRNALPTFPQKAMTLHERMTRR